MPEQIDLTTPDQSKPGTPYYRLEGLEIHNPNPETWRLTTHLGGENGVRRIIEYSGDTARTLIVALMTGDHTATSGHKKLLEFMVANGDLDGTLSGEPIS